MTDTTIQPYALTDFLAAYPQHGQLARGKLTMDAVTAFSHWAEVTHRFNSGAEAGEWLYSWWEGQFKAPARSRGGAA